MAYGKVKISGINYGQILNQEEIRNTHYLGTFKMPLSIESLMNPRT